ncbi:MAG: hypothetical protein MK074_09765, partial [Phycisphaerales bacterium]|nr:hypothetical protein [Phycisphaerales bacterium]
RLPEVPDDALQALSARLQQSAEALQKHTPRMARRLQQDAIDRIDALIRQAQRDQSNSPQPQSADQQQSNPTQPPQPGDGAQQTAQATGAQAGDGAGHAQEAQLGGRMAHDGTIWGTLPPRLRALLEQGRREHTAPLYQNITERYFRSLLKVDR